MDIYTDGSCLGNPGPGGYAILYKTSEEDYMITGEGVPYTTNNRMELQAVIDCMQVALLLDLDESEPIRIHTDSQYVVNAVNQRWLQGWMRRGMRNSKGEPVANYEMWLEFMKYLIQHKFEFVHVRGHAGDTCNELCDQLARSLAERARESGKAVSSPARLASFGR